MITQLITKRTSRNPLIVLISICCGAALTPAHAQDQTPARHGTQYRVSNLDSSGGTSSGGNSINDQKLGGRLFQTDRRSDPARCAVAKPANIRCSTSAHSADQTAVSHGT